MNLQPATQWIDTPPEPDKSAAPRKRLTIRRPSEILAMQFGDDDLIIGDRVLAESQALTMLGQGGLGKSRLALQMAACQILGRPFVGMAVYGAPKRWLFLQSENTNRRLQVDLEKLFRWAGKDAGTLDEHLAIHTLETDDDLDLSVEYAGEALRETVESYHPGIVVCDPLKDFTVRDLNTDVEMQSITRTLTGIVKKGDPKRAIVVLHHALTGKSGAAKATGFDRASFGRNSKVLFNWTRAQINVAPGDSENNEVLVIACGKNSNGREFEKFAVRLNESGIYEIDEEFDFGGWEGSVAGTSSTTQKRKCSPTMAAELLGEDSLKKPEWVRRIMQETGCAKTLAYDCIDTAVTEKLVHYSKAFKTYEQQLRRN